MIVIAIARTLLFFPCPRNKLSSTCCPQGNCTANSHATATITATAARMCRDNDACNVCLCRYAQNRIYSKCGDVLLAINPYCDVSTLLYTDEALFQYSSPRSLSVLDTLPPHPWKTAAKAFRCLVCGSGTGGDGDGWGGPMNQSIVISGESGEYSETLNAY